MTEKVTGVGGERGKAAPLIPIALTAQNALQALSGPGGYPTITRNAIGQRQPPDNPLAGASGGRRSDGPLARGGLSAPRRSRARPKARPAPAASPSRKA